MLCKNIKPKITYIYIYIYILFSVFFLSDACYETSNMWKIPLSPCDVCNATLGAWGTEGLRGWGDWGTDVAGVIGGGDGGL